MSRRLRRLQPATQIFLGFLAFTAVVWLLRGLGILSFLPGAVIWILILLCFGTGIFSSLQKMR
ncbi:MAG: hypothetical protein ICV62_13255 [Cyanobacteria bacterium Co-bin13]|nr:hypothetical protein [Cyanobacteria bacterium Co-bin13]